MNVTGVGSISSYYYNVETNKLVSKSGEDDAFVKWYNGEITEEELPDEFNGYDQCKKCDLEAMMRLMSSGVSGKNVLTPAVDGNLCEISFNIVSAEMTKVSVNGKEVFTSHHALHYTPNEIKTFGKEFDLAGYINANMEERRKITENSHIIPPSTYRKALKRYEEQLYLPLDVFNGRREITKQKGRRLNER